MELFNLDSLGRGGFSGLFFEKQDGDELIFWTHSDRGPNNDEIEDATTGITKRPFLVPGFQPYCIRFSLNRKTKAVKSISKIPFTLFDGTPISGLPNKPGDELPVDSRGTELKRDIHGIDPECLAFDGEFIWLGEEYGPSILKFNLQGRLIKRYLPDGTHLPSKLLERRVNRGFEALTYRGGKVFAMLQSPLKKEELSVLILEFDPILEKVTGEHWYPLDSLETDKIGDMGFWDKSLYVIEQNEKIHNIYEVQLGVLNEQGLLKKRLVLELTAAGYDFAKKVEGLTSISSLEIAVLNDNDFKVNDPTLSSTLGIFKI